MEFFSDIWKLSYISQLNTIYDPTQGKIYKKGQYWSIDKIDTYMVKYQC